MANFARGLAQGLETGVQLGSLYRRKQLRDDLAKLGPEAVTETGQGFEVVSPTGEVQRGLISQQPGVDLGAIQQAYEQGGYSFRPVEAPTFAARAGGRDIGIYGSEAEARRAAEPYNIGLTRRAAGMYEQAGMDAEARQMRGQARQAEADMTRLGMEEQRLRLAQEAGTREEQQLASSLETQEQQRGLTKLQIDKLKRAEEDQARLDAYYLELSQNPQATTADKKAIANRIGLKPEQYDDIIAKELNTSVNTVKLFKAEIQDAIKGKGLDELLDIHKNDSRFDDKTYFNKRVGKNGEIALDLIDQATGKVLRTEKFKDANLATAYLSKQAVEPENIAEWMLGIRGAEAKITAAEANAMESRARAGYLASGGRGGGADKTPFAVKSQIDNSEKTVELIGRQLADRPGDKNLQQQLTVEKFNLANLYKSQGINIDPYRYAGVPSPKTALTAKDIKNLTPDELSARVEVSRQMFGDQYADELASVIQAGRTTTKGGLSKPPTTFEPTTSTKQPPAAPRTQYSAEQRKTLSEQRKREEAEMSEGKRMQYSPEVRAFNQQVAVETQESYLAKEREKERKKTQGLGIQR